MSHAEPAAVLFDLDDTLFDHDHCSRAALRRVRDEHPALCAVPWEELRVSYSRLLEEIHARLLDGELTLQEARRERFRRLFSELGEEASDDLLQAAEELLRRVGERAKVAVVTNNLLREQRDKLSALGLDRYVDALIASEEVGVAKPDPEIFRVALRRVGCAPEEAVAVGDSWASDIAGARAAGIPAVWFNARGAECPEPGAARELRALEPVEEALALLRGGRPGS